MKDLEVWMSFKRGDVQAYMSIYQDYFHTLRGYGSRFTHDRRFVEDTIHDLFIELWEKRERLGVTSSIRPYLTTCLRRKLVRRLTAGSRRRRIEALWEKSVPSAEAHGMEQEESRSIVCFLRRVFRKLTGK